MPAYLMKLLELWNGMSAFLKWHKLRSKPKLEKCENFVSFDFFRKNCRTACSRSTFECVKPGNNYVTFLASVPQNESEIKLKQKTVVPCLSSKNMYFDMFPSLSW